MNERKSLRLFCFDNVAPERNRIIYLNIYFGKAPERRRVIYSKLTSDVQLVFSYDSTIHETSADSSKCKRRGKAFKIHTMSQENYWNIFSLNCKPCRAISSFYHLLDSPPRTPIIFEPLKAEAFAKSDIIPRAKKGRKGS